ncbi:MAG: tetratricopeptide repeat protein [Geobacter sp.]|nr:tetratricopeptide repeat protein [Geobacter sp.]
MRATNAKMMGLIHATFIAAVVVFVYANSLQNDFNIDDEYLVINNNAVHGLTWDNFRAILTSVPNGLEYLPVRDLTYMLDFAFWGLNPFGYHLANLLYYVCFCILFYFVIRKLLIPFSIDAQRISFISTLIFAVHPVHVEAVAGIAQRKDILAGIFSLLSLHYFIRYEKSGTRMVYAVSILSFVLALFSKATVVSFPALILLVDFFLHRNKNDAGFQRRAFIVIPYLLVAAGFTIVQMMIMREAGVISENLHGFGSGYSIRVYSSLRAVFYYLKLLVWPHPLSISPFFEMSRHIYDTTVVLSAVGVILLTSLIFVLRRSQPILSFAIGWYLICLIPVVGLVPTGTIVAERYLLLPSAGFCLAVGYGLSRLVQERRSILRWGALSVLAGTLVFFSVLSHMRNRDWKDHLTLLMANIRDVPENTQIYWMAGKAYFNRGDQEKAFELLDKARKLNPGYEAHYQLFRAIAEYEGERYGEALRMLEKIPAGDAVVDVNYLYGMIYQAQGDAYRARTSLLRAVRSPVSLGVVERKAVADYVSTMGENSPRP